MLCQGLQGEKTSEPQDIARPCYYKSESIYVHCHLIVPGSACFPNKQRDNDDSRNCIVQ